MPGPPPGPTAPIATPAMTAPASAPLEPGNLFGPLVPMARALGLVAEAIGPDWARIRLPYDAQFTNTRGDLHGGALLTLLDCALACAARSIDPVGMAVMTVDLSTHFIAGAASDVVASSRCLRRGKSLAFSQCEVHDAQGNLVATATATLKLIVRGERPPKRPAAA